MLKKFWNSFCQWWQAQQEEEQKKIVEANVKNAERTARSVIQRQLVVVLKQLPCWYNLNCDSCIYDSNDGRGVFMFRIAKNDIQKNFSRAVCHEIVDSLNSNFRQLTFEAVEAMDNVYFESCNRLQNALMNQNSEDFDSVYADTMSAYRVTYTAKFPFLFLLHVITADEIENHLFIAVKIADESAYFHYHPNAFRFG